MESARFDRLARSIGKAPSRRRLLVAVGSAALGAAGMLDGEAAPKAKNKGRKSCKSQAGRGRVIRGLCYALCKNPGSCSAQLGNLPKCGPNNLDCGCTKLLSGNTACILPRGGSDLCGRPACQSNQDCDLDNVCVKVPGCCADRNQVCVFPCMPLL